MTDLLVVGGGPAGAAAAITARLAGAAVTLLEQSRVPRFRPGETLHPGIEPLLMQLQAREAILRGGYLRHSGTWVQWAGAEEFVAFGRDDGGPWLGFQAPRNDFDQRLLGVARASGAQILDGASARLPILVNGRVVGVESDAGPMLASFTIDASGAKHWLARHLGISIARHSPRLIARYGYLDGTADEPSKLPRIASDSRGWTWTADLGHGRYLWTRVTEPANRPLPNWVPPEWEGMRPTSFHGADVTWRIAAKTAGDGWFLCGDAAGVLDPSSSHGVLRAVMSGIMAARLALPAASESPVSDPAAVYDRWLRSWFRHDAAKMAESYRAARLFGF